MMKKFLDTLYYMYELLSNYIPLLAKLYIVFHESSVKKEIEMAHISSLDKILHIGCGAIPYTSIVISRETNAKVVGIDHKSRVVDSSTKFIRSHHLSDKITIQRGVGGSYNVSEFNVIIISYGITNQDVVLKCVLKSAKKDTKIILRRSTANYDSYIDSMVDNFAISRKRMLLTQESILIIKKNQRQSPS